MSDVRQNKHLLRRPLSLATVTAPLAVVPIAVLHAAWAAWQGWNALGEAWMMIVVVVLYSLPAACAGTLLIGLPAFLITRELGLASLWVAALLGSLVGIAATSLMLWEVSVPTVLIGCAYGLPVGVAFIVAERRASRMDRVESSRPYGDKIRGLRRGSGQ